MWYEIRLELDNDGILLVTAPAFPEVISFADDVEDALQHGHDAISEAITRRIADGEPIPEPLKDKPERGYFVEVHSAEGRGRDADHGPNNNGASKR